MLLKPGSHFAINTAEKFASELARVDVPFLTKFDGGGSEFMDLAFEPVDGEIRCGDDHGRPSLIAPPSMCQP